MGVGFCFVLVGFVFNSTALLEWYLCRSSCLTQTSTNGCSIVSQLESKKCVCMSFMGYIYSRSRFQVHLEPFFRLLFFFILVFESI